MDRITSILDKEADELFRAKWCDVYTFLTMDLNFIISIYIT